MIIDLGNNLGLGLRLDTDKPQMSFDQGIRFAEPGKTWKVVTPPFSASAN